jgi:hypothetical protein
MGRRLCAAAALAAVALAAGLAGARAGPAAAAADCVPVQHSKKVVKTKKVRRHGKWVKVRRKRVVRWTTCDPVPAPPAPPVAPCAEPASAVGVTAYDEGGFGLLLSRPCVSAGEVDVNFTNDDAGDHNLFLRPGDGSVPGEPVHRIPATEPYIVPPDGHASGEFDLTPGRWYLWCDLPLHEDAGMNVTLEVGSS